MLEGQNWAVETVGLVQSFGRRRVIQELDLRVPAGAVYGLLGPNGAGKTTLVRTLGTLLPPTAGRALVFGHDVTAAPDEVRSRIALTGQYASVDQDLTGAENLVLVGRLLGLRGGPARRRAEELLELFDLGEAARRAVKTYSGGMRRRLDLAASVVVMPDLLVLDEPTTGLDPHSRNNLWAVVRVLVATGTTVLLTTQYLGEADRLADRVGVLDRGRLIAEGTPSELKDSIGSRVFRVRLHDPSRREEAARVVTLLGAEPESPGADAAALVVRMDASTDAVRLLDELDTREIAVAEFSLGQPSLDDVFLALTGHPAEHEEEAA